jgi:hypothetical protein
MRVRCGIIDLASNELQATSNDHRSHLRLFSAVLGKRSKEVMATVFDTFQIRVGTSLNCRQCLEVHLVHMDGGIRFDV